MLSYGSVNLCAWCLQNLRRDLNRLHREKHWAMKLKWRDSYCEMIGDGDAWTYEQISEAENAASRKKRCGS